MRMETNHLKVQMRRKMQQLTVVVDQRRELMHNEADLFKSPQQLASSRDWLLYGSDGKYCCGVCTRHASQFANHQQRASKWIMGNGGYKHSSTFSVYLCKHDTSSIHILAMGLEPERTRDPLQFRSQYGIYLVKLLMRLVKAAHERTKLY